MNEYQSLKLSAFINQAQSVIDWNLMKYESGLLPFTEKDEINNQIAYTQSEAQEIIDAISDRNAREVIDGVCDTFVTAVFMIPLTRSSGQEIDHSILIETGRRAQSWASTLPTLDRKDVIHLIHASATRVINDAHDILSVMKLCYLLDVLGVDVIGSIEAVMESNWSKYPLESRLKRHPDDECRWIEANRNRVDVRHINSAGRFVFRDKMGSGKIMKPSTFFEPVFKPRDVDLLDWILFK